jgi:GAF domain-containing protein
MTALPPDVVADLTRENARLLTELRTAGDRQAGSAEILRAIASAPGDAERSLQQIAETTARLFGCQSVRIRIAENDQWSRTISVGASAKRVDAELSAAQMRIGARNLPGTVLLENRQVHIPDLDDVDPAIADWPGLPPARAAGTRTMAGTPLRREGKAIGVLVVYRDRLAPFTADELALLQSFADQAVIAIENARLFNETREALARQTATAEILRVISQSPTDVRPVFDAIVLTAVRLIGCDLGFVLRCDGTTYSPAAAATPGGPMADLGPANLPIDPSVNFPSRAIVDKKMLHLPDWSLIDLPEHERHIHKMFGVNAALYLPLLREGECIGLLALAGKHAGIFGESAIALAESFRDQALIAIENVRLFNETREALERQTATAEILKVIASSPGDVQPVFDAIATSANRLIGGFSATVMRFVGDALHLVAFTPTNPTADEALQASFPRPLAEFPPFELVRGGETVQFPDTESEDVPPLNRELARLRGYRGMVFTPLMSNGAPIGILSVTRAEPGTFAAHHVQLLQTFADQAAIAVENAQLFEQVQAKTRDLTESLQQQTATADVLKVISRSAFDLDSVMNTLARSASELCGADLSALFLREGDLLVLRGHSEIDQILADFLRQTSVEIDDQTYMGRAVLSGTIANVPDFSSDTTSRVRTFQQATGFKAMLIVPLMREGRGVGVFALCRNRVGVFSQRQIELVQTFADQAVIAIENVRLFDEVQAKTRDLSEALTYQTGSGNILRVIASSPIDVGPVLKAIVESACELCDAFDAVVLLKDGEDLRFSAHHGPIPMSLEKWPINRNWTAGRAFLDRKPVHVHDLLSSEGDDFPEGREMSRRMGHRSILSVPLLREGESIGTIVLRRTEVHPFSDKQITLLQTFADQAVIALGNVRMFEQVQARTEDLRESLQFQTATSDVLKVISSSPDSLRPVLDVIVETSRHLCGTETSTIFLLKDERFHIAAASGAMPEYLEFLRNNPIALDQAGSSTSRAAREKRTVHIPDIGADPEFGQGPMAVGQRRALLSVPLMREGTAIGVITMRQSHLTPFTERQIEVVQTFADQAVIAISNVRLFEEVQQRTQELSKSLDELRTAQDRLVQTEKLASLGQLTAGIAHEIKNPLNFVNNFSALSAELTDELNDVLKSAALGDKIREEVDELTGMLKDNLEKVVQHGKRADSIVKNMLLHSREGSGEHRPADINALLDESLNLAYHGARAEKPQFNVTLQRDFDEMAGTIEVFPQEITRVFLNLISNGFYAVTKRKTENGSSGFDPVLRATTRNLGDTVEIRIRDNGTGIPAEVQEKMFNPFFTTKPAGEGTGLGLSMSHDIIVKQHGGTIDVETEPGQFTEFRIVLPRSSNLTNKTRGQT